MGYNKNGEILRTGVNQDGYRNLKINDFGIKSPVKVGEYFKHPFYGVGKVMKIEGKNIFTQFKGQRNLLSIDKEWLSEKFTSGDAEVKR